MTSIKTARGRTGFTLIELLVVIAIIAILAAILFPVFARARENARRSSCSSNLKQIALGVFQYTQDYDEKFPIRYSTATSYYLNGWAAAVQPYVKSAQLFQCPSEPTAPGTFDSDNATDYAYNANLGQIDAAISLAAVNFPSVTVMNFDYVSRSVEAGDYDAYGYGAAPTIRHLDGANYSFVDGHVKWYRPEKVLTASTVNGNGVYSAVKCASTGASYAGNGNPTFCL
jgi:prepilin-type N-terminal cleavage/methylation domain-containing protein/prepilin-type processing-associated H-X9-DG protein